MITRPLVKAFVGVLALVATACQAGSASPGIGIARSLNVAIFEVGDRREAPAFEGESLRPGEPFDSAALSGKVGVVNFWGSWCGPCRREQPMLEAMWKEYGPRGAVFVGINTRRDQRAAALSFLDEFEVSYPSIYNPDSRIAFRYAVRYMPATIVVDRSGRIAARITGALPNEVPLRRILDAELTR